MGGLKPQRDPLFDRHELTPSNVVFSVLGLVGLLALGIANFLASGH